MTKVVNRIKAINEVHHEHTGDDGAESEQYKNYLILKDRADIKQMLTLTKNDNPVVAAYAGWALIDRGYTCLPALLQQFLDSGISVTILSGCIQEEEAVSSVFYHRYWNNVDERKRATDKCLLAFDSILLYHEHANRLLRWRALENRLYPQKFNERIAILAFKQNDIHAILYLSNWYKAAYNPEIKQALLSYLQTTEFRLIGTSFYYQVVAELLEFHDPAIRQPIVDKLKKDRHWKYEEERFFALLQDYNIFRSDIEGW